MKKPVSQRAIYQRVKRVLAKRDELLRKASPKDTPVEFYVIDHNNCVVNTYNSLYELANDLSVIAEFEEMEE